MKVKTETKVETNLNKKELAEILGIIAICLMKRLSVNEVTFTAEELFKARMNVGIDIMPGDKDFTITAKITKVGE